MENPNDDAPILGCLIELGQAVAELRETILSGHAWLDRITNTDRELSKIWEDGLSALEISEEDAKKAKANGHHLDALPCRVRGDCDE